MDINRSIRWRLAVAAAALAVELAGPALASDNTSEGTAGSRTSPQSHHGGSRPAEMSDSRLKFEVNATDQDGGVQVFIDADQWKQMSIFDPHGRRIVTSTTKGRMGEQGGTELFLESAEPSFDEPSLEQLLQRWPEGEYNFRGRGLNGETYVGSADLTHRLPDGPTLVSPVEGDGPQDPDHTVVEWQPVGDADGSPIIAYQVPVVQPETGHDGLPSITLDIMMPSTATSVVVPPGFLQPDTEYEWEVLAIEESGNQTRPPHRP